MTNLPCVLCATHSNHTRDRELFQTVWCHCPKCGNYLIGAKLRQTLSKGKDTAFRIACMVRTKGLANPTGTYRLIGDDTSDPSAASSLRQAVSTYEIRNLLADFPKPEELIDRSLQNLRRLVTHPADTVTCSWEDLSYYMFTPKPSLMNQYNSMRTKALLRDVASTRTKASFIIAPDGWDRIEKMEKKPMVIIGTPKNEVFVVHGHDRELLSEVSRLLERLGLKPIVLSEQPDKGRTIIEKFEQHSDDVKYAVVLLTPDDEGGIRGKNQRTPRARQNVVFELGYFIAKLGRDRVCSLVKEDVEHPSDVHGILYKTVDAAGAWKYALANEMKESGLEIDLNKLR